MADNVNVNKALPTDYISAGSAALGALSGLFGLYSQHKANQQNQRNFETNIALQRELQDKQLQFQKDMYEDAKIYNSIPNQAMQYMQAGLNPLAMMEKGNSFAPASAMTGGSASAPAQPNIQALHPDFTGLQQGLQSIVDNRIKNEQARNLQYENAFKVQKLQLEISDRIKELELKSNKSSLDMEELRRLRMQNDVYSRMQNDLVRQQKNEADKTGAEFNQIEIENSFRSATNDIRADLMRSELKLSNKTIEEIDAKIKKIGYECYVLMTQGQLNLSQIDDIVAGIKLKTQDFLIHRPDEIRAYNETRRYRTSPKVNHFIDAFSDFMGKIIPSIPTKISTHSGTSTINNTYKRIN